MSKIEEMASTYTDKNFEMAVMANTWHEPLTKAFFAGARAVLEEARRQWKCQACGKYYPDCQQHPNPCREGWYVEGDVLEALFKEEDHEQQA